MPTEQAQAAPLVPDLDLAAMRVTLVPDVWPPLDGAQAAGTFPALTRGPGGVGPTDRADHGDRGDRGDRGDHGDRGDRGDRGDHGDRGDRVDKESPQWPRQFAVLLAEALAGARPLQQVLPWMSRRGSTQLRRLQPLFGDGHRPRIVRVLTTAPSSDVIEMTLIVAAGPRTRALAVRLVRAPQDQRPAWRGKPATRWLCTDIEAA